MYNSSGIINSIVNTDADAVVLPMMVFVFNGMEEQAPDYYIP